MITTTPASADAGPVGRRTTSPQFALLLIVLIGLTLTVVLMHEQKIDDKYVTFLEGFVGGAFSTWTLSLKGDKPHTLPPNPPQLPQIPQLPQLPPVKVVPVTGDIVPVVPPEDPAIPDGKDNKKI